MASSTSTPVTLSCKDSGLSIAGNVIGILTLFYALAIGLTYWIDRMKDGPEEMARIQGRVDLVSDDLYRLQGDMRSLMSDLSMRGIGHETCHETSVILHQFFVHTEEARQAQKELEQSSNLHYGRVRFRDRARFAVTEKMSGEALFKLEEALGKARTIRDEFSARVQDQQRLEQNQLLIAIHKRLFDMEERMGLQHSKPSHSNNDPAEELAPTYDPDEDVLNSLMRPRRQRTDLGTTQKTSHLGHRDEEKSSRVTVQGEDGV